MSKAVVLRCVFAGLVWLSRLPISQAVQSARTPAEICVERWDFSWSPEHYSIAIELDPGNQTFKGNVTIEGRMTETSSRLELNCENLTVQHVSFDPSLIRHFFIEDDILIVQLSEHLERGSKLVLNIEYEGVFHESLGVIMKKFPRNSFMIATNLEPVFARRVFPCLDFPRYKATFDVAIKRPEPELQVLSNMPEKSSSDSESEWVAFERTPIMSTYLVAFIVTDYVPFKLNGTNRNLTTDIKIWVPRHKIRSPAVKLAAKLTDELLYHLQNFIGANFTLPKLDLFSVPPFEENVGGMENWGLIVIREKSLMKQKRSSVSEEMEIIYTITHELAHDWFGNLVTIEDWCSVWIQEGLASYIQAIIPTQVFSNVDMVNIEKWHAREYVLDDECHCATELRSLNMDKTSNTSSLFTSTDYHKGAAVLFMLESVVTRPVFHQALRNFIANNQYAYVNDADLWTAIQNSADASGVQLPANVSEIMSSWVNQGGHPIVNVDRDENGTVTVSQVLCSSGKQPTNFWIPLTYTTKSEKDFNDTSLKMWLLDTELAQLDVVLHPTDWIILNIQNAGVYRVNYDSTTWILLARQLRHNHHVIHPVNRAILIDDAFRLASVGLISYTVPLRLLEYLGDERSGYVWEVVYANVWTLINEQTAFPSEEEQLLEKYIGILLDSIYPAVKYFEDYERELEWYDERKLRGVVYEFASFANYRPYKRDAVALIEEIAVNRINNDTGYCECLPSELSEHTIWTVALAEGSPSLLDLRVQHYTRAKDSAMKYDIMNEMTQPSVMNRSNVTKFMHWLADLPVNDDIWEYYIKVFQDSWPTKCQELWAFFEGHWIKFQAAYEEYRRFLELNDEGVPPTPSSKEGTGHMLERFLQFTPMVETMTATCFDVTKTAFGVSQTKILERAKEERADTEASDETLRDAIGRDVLVWLRKHAKETT